MIKSITATNYLGESIKLELARPELSGFAIKSISGLGPVKAEINTTEVATVDVSRYNSARLTNRNIVLSLVYFSDGSVPIEDIRQKSYKHFPIKKNVKLVVETDNRLAEISGYVESNDPNIFSKVETAEISIICPDPFFYSSGEQGTNTTIFFGVEPMFEAPFSNESLTEPLIEVGIIHNKTENVVTYLGDAEVGIKITINAIGPVSDISIYNTLTREIMRIDVTKLAALTGSGIIAGDEIDICTEKGNKYITLLRNGVLTNILNCLDKNADWFQLSKGDNLFAYVAESGSENLQFRIEHKIVYEGV